MKDSFALVLDAQAVSEHVDLDVAHTNKVNKYKPFREYIKQRYKVETVDFETTTLSYRGIWSQKSAEDLKTRKIIKASELKIISSRVLIGGLSGFWGFNKTTEVKRRTGVG